jgi:alpha-ketoglutaric semialdehyde dehydrogenase
MSFDNMIGGVWCAGDSTAPNINPSDRSDIVADFAVGDSSQAGDAIAAAAEALPRWAATSGLMRFEILDRAGSEILARADDLGNLLAREEGKTLAEAVGEVRRAGQIFKFHAGQSLRQLGQSVESLRPGVDVTVRREPVGVVSVITPWNFPMAIPAWKIAPALAYGNTVVFKPAELVPGSAWQLVDILNRAGLPSGVLNLVMGRGQEIGSVLTGSPQVHAVSFTGSTATGRRVLASAQSHLARVQLEMGGKNPLVVLDDADLDVAVSQALEGAFGSTGQRCTASSRIVVTDGIHDAFVEELVGRLGALTVGDARHPDTQIGPVVDAVQLQQDLDYVQVAADEGAEVIGGRPVSRPTEGFYMEPALLLGTSQNDTVNREEVFGPVASVLRVADYTEALAVANDTEFGLTAGIVTRSLSCAADFQRRSTAGMVMVNLATAGVDFHVPFGGRGSSSYGPREQGQTAQEFYTTTKTSYVAAGGA